MYSYWHQSPPSGCSTNNRHNVPYSSDANLQAQSVTCIPSATCCYYYCILNKNGRGIEWHLTTTHDWRRRVCRWASLGRRDEMKNIVKLSNKNTVFMCNRPCCKTCPIHPPINSFSSLCTNLTYPITSHADCKSMNLIYQLQRNACKLFTLEKPAALFLTAYLISPDSISRLLVC